MVGLEAPKEDCHLSPVVTLYGFHSQGKQQSSAWQAEEEYVQSEVTGCRQLTRMCDNLCRGHECCGPTKVCPISEMLRAWYTGRLWKLLLAAWPFPWLWRLFRIVKNN